MGFLDSLRRNRNNAQAVMAKASTSNVGSNEEEDEIEVKVGNSKHAKKSSASKEPAQRMKHARIVDESSDVKEIVGEGEPAAETDKGFASELDDGQPLPSAVDDEEQQDGPADEFEEEPEPDDIPNLSEEAGDDDSQGDVAAFEEESAFSPHVKGDTKIISIINQKGGVGKTTTAVNLSAVLADMGYKTLLVDLDPQGNTTSGLGVEKRDLERCVYDVLLNDEKADDALVRGVLDNMDLLPATINLAGAEVELVTEFSRETRLKEAISSISDAYDYVFIDCPPSLGLLTVNGLVAADSLLIPIQSEFYALEGVTKLLDSMKLVKTRLNQGLDIFGVLITMYDSRTTLSRQVAKEVRNYFGDKVFETIIPRTVKLSEAPSFGEPIIAYDPDGRGAEAYTKLAKEVIERG